MEGERGYTITSAQPEHTRKWLTLQTSRVGGAGFGCLFSLVEAIKRTFTNKQRALQSVSPMQIPLLERPRGSPPGRLHP